MNGYGHAGTPPDVTYNLTQLKAISQGIQQPKTGHSLILSAISELQFIMSRFL